MRNESAKARDRLLKLGLIRKEGSAFVVTEAGHAWTDRQIAQLKRQRIEAA